MRGQQSNFNSEIVTDGQPFALNTINGIDLFNPLPEGATPLASGPLVSVIPDAGLGGVNALLNPITGQPITTDVFGNPRVNAAGFRDIGAVQVPEPSSVMGTIAGVAFFGMISLRKRSAQFKNRHR